MTRSLQDAAWCSGWFHLSIADSALPFRDISFGRCAPHQYQDKIWCGMIIPFSWFMVWGRQMTPLLLDQNWAGEDHSCIVHHCRFWELHSDGSAVRRKCNVPQAWRSPVSAGRWFTTRHQTTSWRQPLRRFAGRKRAPFRYTQHRQLAPVWAKRGMGTARFDLVRKTALRLKTETAKGECRFLIEGLNRAVYKIPSFVMGPSIPNCFCQIGKNTQESILLFWLHLSWRNSENSYQIYNSTFNTKFIF